MTGEG
jgi:hypothetical protein